MICQLLETKMRLRFKTLMKDNPAVQGISRSGKVKNKDESVMSSQLGNQLLVVSIMVDIYQEQE